MTANLSASENLGTRDARYVIAALSLKAVRMVEASINGHLLRVPRTGPIHHCWQPPWMIRAARKKPTSNGGRSAIVCWFSRVAETKARKKRKPKITRTE